MCERMVQAAIQDLWVSRGGTVDLPPGFHPSYNISPRSPILVLRTQPGGWSADMMSWGRAPSGWVGPPGAQADLFRAGSEAVASGPSFRAAFQRQRCIIPADGYFEWRSLGGKTRQPYYIHPSTPGEVFAFAGIWERWETSAGATESCTVLTTASNSLMAEIHKRMPVILSPFWLDEWLDPASPDRAMLARLMVPSDPAAMSAHRVSPLKGDGPSLLLPLAWKMEPVIE